MCYDNLTLPWEKFQYWIQTGSNQQTCFKCFICYISKHTAAQTLQENKELRRAKEICTLVFCETLIFL